MCIIHQNLSAIMIYIHRSLLPLCIRAGADQCFSASHDVSNITNNLGVSHTPRISFKYGTVDAKDAKCMRESRMMHDCKVVIADCTLVSI